VVNGNSGVSVLLGNGDGSFQAAVNYAVGNFPSSVAVGDFRHNGTLDLAVAFSGGVRMLLGNGDGTFQTTHIRYVAGSNPSYVAVGDFNGDGFPDLAVANVGSNDVSILLNDTNWPGGGGAPSRRAGKGLPTDSLTAVSLLAGPRTISALWQPIAPSNGARPEPWASPLLVDAFFAAAPREEGAGAAVPLVCRSASSAAQWQPLLNDLDLLAPTITTMAWEEM